MKFDEKSDGILVGFSDGVIRYLKLRSGIKPNGIEKKFELDLRMIQVLKPHTKAVTFITVDVKNQWIATGVCFELKVTFELLDLFRVLMERYSSLILHQKV